MEGHHLDPHLRGLPERLQLLLERRAELAAVRILAAEQADCSLAVLVLCNRLVCQLDYQLSCRGAGVCPR